MFYYKCTFQNWVMMNLVQKVICPEYLCPNLWGCTVYFNITEHLQNKVGAGVCTWRTRPVYDSPSSCHQTLSCGGRCMKCTASSPPSNPCPLLLPSINMIFGHFSRKKKKMKEKYIFCLQNWVGIGIPLFQECWYSSKFRFCREGNQKR